MFNSLLVFPRIQCNSVQLSYLRRLIYGLDDSLDPQWNLGIFCVPSVKKPDSLRTGFAPRVDKVVNDGRRRKLHMIYHTELLRIQGDGTRLALCAHTLWP